MGEWKTLETPTGKVTFGPTAQRPLRGVCWHKRHRRWLVRYKGKYVGWAKTLEQANEMRRAYEFERQRRKVQSKVKVD